MPSRLQIAATNPWVGRDRKSSHITSLMREVNKLQAFEAQETLDVEISDPYVVSSGISLTLDDTFGPIGSDVGEFDASYTAEGSYLYGGELYAVDTLDPKLQVYSASGTFAREWALSGTAKSVWVASGEVFVGVLTLVRVYNTSGSLLRTISTSLATYGICCVYSGELYVIGDGAVLNVYSVAGVFSRSFTIPTNKLWISVDVTTGELYVITTSAVRVYNTSGVLQRTWSTPSGNSSVHCNGTYVAITRGAYIFLYDTIGNVLASLRLPDATSTNAAFIDSTSIYLAQSDGASVLSDRIAVVGIDVSAQALSAPEDVAAFDSSSVYVTDSGNDRVIKYDEDGNYDSTYGSAGTGNGEFDAPTGIATDSAGNVFVVDTGNNRIQKFNSSGVYQSQFGSAGSGDGQFSGPTRIFIDADDNIYVADTGNNRIQKFNSAGTYQMQWGANGASPGYLSSPMGIALSGDDKPRAYVANSGNNRVEAFIEFSSSASKYSNMFGESGSGANRQFSAPEGVDIDSDGHLYVVDTGNNRLYKLASRGRVAAVYGSAGSGLGEFDEPSGVAVLGNYIFVVDRANNRVQRLTQATTVGDPVDYQTEWKLYLSREVNGSNEVSMGTPDRGLHIPDLGAIDMGVPKSELDPDVVVVKAVPTYFSVVRKAVERLAASDVFTNPDTGIFYDFSADDENAVHRSMSSKWDKYYHADGHEDGDTKRAWDQSVLGNQSVADLTIGEVNEVISRLKKSTLEAIT